MTRLAFLLAAPAAAALLAPGPAAAQSPCGESYTVRPGDTLYSIAQRCRTSIAAIMAANPYIRSRSRIEIGWRLAIPGGRAERDDRYGHDRDERYGHRDRYEDRYEDDRYDRRHGDRWERHTEYRRAYRVRAGDTIWSIARGLGLAEADLIDANPDLDPRFLEPGDLVFLPGRHDSPPWRDEPRRGDDRDDPHGMRVTGVITREGVECPALRGEDGRLYTLAGETGRFGPGDRVTVTGTEADMSFCMQGVTIDVRDIRAAGWRRD